MKKEAGMDGAGTRLGLAGAVARGLAVVMALRWRALFLAVLLLPAAAWGEQTAREVLKEQRDHRLWKEVGRCDGAERYLKAFPEGLHADEARECPTERRAEEIELPDGLTLADWALMAEDRLEAGDHARLLEEAGAHLREYGPIESVEEIREQAVSGLMAEIRVTTREDAPKALERIARIEAAAGERPELLRLRARAHGLLDDHAAAEAAYLRWLRAVPQSHPERRDVLAALTRVRAEREMREKTRRFSERLGRPFSAEWKEDSVGWTDLHYAALLDLPEVVAALCDAGMDADTRLKSGSPPFGDDLKRTLAELGHEEFKVWNADGETPLIIAAGGNARNAAAALFDCGADVNAKNSKSDLTPLYYAALRNSLDVAKLLIEHGADVNANVTNGNTPLHIAANRGFYDMVKLLIDRGAAVNAKDEDGETPLLVSYDLDLMKLLIDRGADVNASSNDGSTRLGIAFLIREPDITKLLIDHGANGWTPLFLAVIENRLDVAKRLIDLGADVNAKGASGWTPLHLAGNLNSLDMAKLLIDHGADVNEKMNNGWTLLLWAAALHNDLGMLDMAKLLIDHGADVEAKNSFGSLPLTLAAEDNALDMAKLLIDYGADVNATDNYGNTPLNIAALHNYPDMAKLLIDHGADVNTKGASGLTPLHPAANRGFYDMAKLLIDHGADVNANTNIDYGGGDNATAKDVKPLHFAAEKNFFDVAKLLIDHGADVNAAITDTRTPPILAVVDNDLDMAKLLIDRGANVNATGRSGESPLDRALDMGHTDMQALLRESGGVCKKKC